MRNITVYMYEELSPEAQGKALSKFDLDYSDWLYDDMILVFRDRVGNLIDNFSLEYSLNYCQGDGVCFYGKLEGKKELLALAKLVYGNDIPHDIKRLCEQEILWSVDFRKINYYYSHPYTVDIYTEANRNYFLPHTEKIVNRFEKHIKNWFIDLCKDMEKYGYDNIGYYNSDECKKEYIADAMIEYFEDGSVLRSNRK